MTEKITRDDYFSRYEAAKERFPRTVLKIRTDPTPRGFSPIREFIKYSTNFTFDSIFRETLACINCVAYEEKFDICSPTTLVSDTSVLQTFKIKSRFMTVCGCRYGRGYRQYPNFLRFTRTGFLSPINNCSSINIVCDNCAGFTQLVQLKNHTDNDTMLFDTIRFFVYRDGNIKLDNCRRMSIKEFESVYGNVLNFKMNTSGPDCGTCNGMGYRFSIMSPNYWSINDVRKPNHLTLTCVVPCIACGMSGSAAVETEVKFRLMSLRA